MNNFSNKRIFRSFIILLIAISVLLGSFFITEYAKEPNPSNVQSLRAKTDVISKKAPKYVFMFIGDGMAAVQVNAAQIYKGTNKPNNISLKELNFQKFDSVGYQTTHDATSFAPDSASTATALSSGFKTWSGTLGLKPIGNISGNKAENINSKIIPKTIAERLKEERDMKIGIVSTVTLNHATPAAYYAHIPSRNDYYEIALQMADSNFDYFGGGRINKPTGNDKDKKDAYEIMKEKGYKIVDTKEDILSLTNKDKKVYALTPVVQDSGAMPYAIDNKKGDLELKDFVKKGIDVLDNDKGFFMMVESGKIDWSGHANDAKTNIEEVLAFEESVKVAIDFYNKHPEETLIIVTGDHETGGMTIGQATTGYDVALDILDNQKMSYVAFDNLIDEMISKNKNIKFEDVLPVITENFGLKDEYKDSDNVDSYMSLELSDREVAKLKKAFDETLKEERTKNEETLILYGGYNPLSVTLTHILNNKSGIGWTSYAHTGVPVPVYAKGVNQGLFNGAYDNTDVYHKLVDIMKLK